MQVTEIAFISEDSHRFCASGENLRYFTFIFLPEARKKVLLQKNPKRGRSVDCGHGSFVIKNRQFLGVSFWGKKLKTKMGGRRHDHHQHHRRGRHHRRASVRRKKFRRSEQQQKTLISDYGQRNNTNHKSSNLSSIRSGFTSRLESFRVRKASKRCQDSRNPRGIVEIIIAHDPKM